MSLDAIKLKFDQLQFTLDQASKSINDISKLSKDSNELKEWAINEVTKFALQVRTNKVDKDELSNFFKYPYCTFPGNHEGEVYLAIPKFIDAHFGWLHKVTPSFNIFLVNRYVDWLGELPQALKNELKFQDPLDLYLEGDYLIGKDIEIAKRKFGKFIKRVEKDKLLIDKSQHFEMLASLIKEGILPFKPQPVDPNDLINRYCNFELRDYQKTAWDEFLKFSNIGAFFPPSTGKTFLALWAMTHIKPPHFVGVPTRLLVEQWKERIELYTDLKPDEYDIMTYHSAIKINKKYKLRIVDEVHHLPSNEFSKMMNIQCDYGIGLSATPQREDGREEYIFALTGKPVGLAWETFKQLGVIQNPPLHVWIVKNDSERINELERLLQEEQKTIIFCDSIDMGKTISKKFDLPHIHGTSKERLTKIKESPTSVVSRVGDEGISLPDITRVIEVSWLHGSRRQELQRFTRLLHGQSKHGEGHIIMTGQEYETDHKRLFSIMDKGFKIVLHREGYDDKEVKQIVRTKTLKEPRVRQQRIVKEKVEKQIQPLSEVDYPLLKFSGVRKIVESLSKAQRKVLLFLLSPQNQNQMFTVEQIALSLGISYPKYLTTHPILNPMIKKNYVVKVGNKYKQNFSSMVS